MSRLDEAAAAYLQAAHLEPKMTEAYSNLGVIGVKQGQNQKALSYLDHAIRLSPGSAEAHMNRGVALSNLGNRNAAISSLRRAIALKPNYGNAYRNLATLYLQAGKVDSAEYFQSLAHSH